MHYDKLQRDSLKARWKGDMLLFAKEALQFDIEPHHHKMQDAISEHDRLLMLLPIGHGKSWLCSYAYPLWLVLNDPDKRVCVITKSDRRAADWNMQISRALLYNPVINEVYKELIPNKPDRWNTSAIVLNRSVNHKEPTISTIGYGGQIESMRLNIIILDDVIDEEIARSGIENPNVKERFNRIIERRLEPEGRIIVVGTPYSPNDLYAYLQDKSQRTDYHTLKLPAIDAEGNPLWAKRFSLDDLMKIKHNNPAHIWEQAYMLNALSSEFCKFKPEWLQNLNRQPWKETPAGGVVYSAWDPAIGERPSSDYTAGVIGAQVGHELFIEDMYAEKITSGHGLTAHTYAVKYNIAASYFEVNAFQVGIKRDFEQELPRKTAIGITNMTGGSGKAMGLHGKSRILDGLEPYFRNGDIWFNPRLKGTKVWDMFYTEFVNYGSELGGHRDDHLLDALEMLVSKTIALSGGRGGSNISASESPDIGEYQSRFSGGEYGRDG